jgi:hypothetical protein
LKRPIKSAEVHLFGETGKSTPKMYFIYESNPAYANPESGLTSEVLKDERLILTLSWLIAT